MWFCREGFHGCNLLSSSDARSVATTLQRYMRCKIKVTLTGKPSIIATDQVIAKLTKNKKNPKISLRV
jgi:hypothetical protein